MKKTLGLILTILGAGGLIFGIIKIFTGDLTTSSAWIGVILGGIFFSSGIGLLKSTKS